MTRQIILSAGEASRMPGAPYGCKSLVMVNDQTVLDWQLCGLALEGSTSIVVRNQAARAFGVWPDLEVIVHDETTGPVRALQSADPTEPCVVLFADTLFDYLPPLDESWVGVNIAAGGRVWEWTNDDGFVVRKHLRTGRYKVVHVGAYYFDDPDRLRAACKEHRTWPRMLQEYGVDNEAVIPHWMDVGDEAALAYANEHWLDE